MPTIYDLPESVNTDYARRQAQYDREVAAGRVTPGGIVEAAVHQAARIRSTVSQPSQLVALFGLNIQAQIAFFIPMPSAEVMRGFTTMGTPSLGSIAQREAYKEHIRSVLHVLAPQEGRSARGGEAIIAALEQTIERDQEASRILGWMGSLTAG